MSWPYPHRTLAEVERAARLGCRCEFPLERGHDRTCPIKSRADYDLRQQRAAHYRAERMAG